MPYGPSNFSGRDLTDVIMARPDLSPVRYYATAPRTFIESVQQRLREYPYRTKKSYRVYGPLGGWIFGGGTNTDFDTDRLEGDGRWGPVTNAALWRYIAEHARPDARLLFPEARDFDPITLRYLDAIENVARTGELNELALRAAEFVWMQNRGQEPPLSWTRFLAAQSTFPYGIARLPTFRPTNETAPPVPANPANWLRGTREWVAWNSNQVIPGVSSEAEGTRPPGTPGSPGRVENGVVVPPDGGKGPANVGPGSGEVPLALYGVGLVVTVATGWMIVDTIRKVRRANRIAPAEFAPPPVPAPQKGGR